MKIEETVERCEECGTPMRFLVEDTDKDQDGNSYLCGVYQCPKCGFEEIGTLDTGGKG